MVTRRARGSVLLAATLVAGVAFARWDSGPIGPVTPSGVTMLDAGVAVVAHEQGATAVYGAPGAFAVGTMFDGGAMVGARLGPGGCVYGLKQGSAELAGTTPQCGVAQVLSAQPSNGGKAFALTPRGGGFAIYRGQLFSTIAHHDDAGHVGPWVNITFPITSPGAGLVASATSVSGRDWLAAWSNGALIGATEASASNVSTVPSAVARLVLYEHTGVPALLLAFVDGGLAQTDEFRVDGGLVLAPLAGGPPGGTTALAFTELEGDADGRGFGLAAGDAGLWGAVPNPSAPGRVWVRRGELVIPAPIDARCVGASACVVISAENGSAQAVSWYFNSFSPQLLGAAPAVSTPDGVRARAAAGVTDLDGDPLWVTWEPVDAGPGRAVLVSPVQDAGADFNELADLTPSGFGCGAEQVPFSYRVSDGMATHVGRFTGQLTVTRAEAPGPPVPSASGVLVYAGLGGATLGYTPSDAGCPATAVTWSATPGTGFTGAALADGGFALTPDAHHCARDAGAVTLTLSNATGSSTATIPVQVEPWGRPDVTGFSAGTQLALDAGSDLGVTLNMTHPCALALGFPALEALVFVDGGGPTLQVTRSGGAGVHVYSLDECVSDSLELFGRGRVFFEDAGRESLQTARLGIDVVANLPPLSSGRFDAGPAYDAPNARVVGDLSLALKCLAQRGVAARIAVWRDGGTLVAGPTLFPIPGPWALPVPGGCSGGRFYAHAEVVQDGGAATGLEQVHAFEAQALPAGVGEVSPAQVLLRCGEPLGLTTRALPAADACNAQEYLWRQIDGPALEATEARGAQVDWTSPEDFDALVGTALAFELAADAGLGNVSAPVRHTVALRAAPFVRLTHAAEPALAREGEATPIVATLENLSDCDVSALALHETLGRLRYVPGSVRVDGAPGEAVAADGTLTVSALAIAARGRTRVTWLARAPLLSSLAVEGTVTMRSAQVNLQPEAALPLACGCGPGGGLAQGAWVLVLGALWRRRSQRCG